MRMEDGWRMEKMDMWIMEVREIGLSDVSVRRNIHFIWCLDLIDSGS